MKLKSICLIAALSLSPSLLHAHNLVVGEPILSTVVSEGGMASLSGEEINFLKWSPSDISFDKTVVIVASAARPEANAMMPEDLFNSLKKADNVSVYKIVNSDDAPFGAGMFIEGAIKKGKAAEPESNVVLDEDGELFNFWDLQEESSMIAIIKDGKVAYVIEGTIGNAEKTKILDMVK